eukprot:jgi/Bigna1/75937/fgenesh1_pg.38_\
MGNLSKSMPSLIKKQESSKANFNNGLHEVLLFQILEVTFRERFWICAITVGYFLASPAETLFMMCQFTAVVVMTCIIFTWILVQKTMKAAKIDPTASLQSSATVISKDSNPVKAKNILLHTTPVSPSPKSQTSSFTPMSDSFSVWSGATASASLTSSDLSEFSEDGVSLGTAISSLSLSLSTELRGDVLYPSLSPSSTVFSPFASSPPTPKEVCTPSLSPALSVNATISPANQATLIFTFSPAEITKISTTDKTPVSKSPDVSMQNLPSKVKNLNENSIISPPKEESTNVLKRPALDSIANEKGKLNFLSSPGASARVPPRSRSSSAGSRSQKPSPKVTYSRKRPATHFKLQHRHRRTRTVT